MRKASYLGLALRAAALAIPLVVAGVAEAQQSFTKIDPKILRTIRTGLVGPMQKGKLVAGPARVLIELTHQATASDLDALRAMGVAIDEVEGAPVAMGPLVVGVVDEPAVKKLGASAIVKQVQGTSTRGPAPLDHSAELLHLDDARGARPALDLMTGEGIVVGDVDSNVDPFQPAFFKGDAGYYDFIDLDHDGVFTPGVDAIDLDGDGMASPDEIGQLIIADTVDFYGKEQAARTKDFDPSTDWIYLDTNGNGQRDYGAPDFDDSVPAFGEPLFVPDDVNRNGKVDVGERFVRLGTSKIRDMYTHLAYIKNVNKKYHRGTDLSTLVVNQTSSQLYGYPDALHATGVLTIVAGDVPLVGRRWVGMAPDADIVLAWDVENTSDGLPTLGATWMLQQKPDVALYELAPWTGDALDGTDPLSKIIDNADPTITQTCPTGDQGSAGKHGHIELAAAASGSMTYELPDKDKGGQGPFSYAQVTLDVRGGTVKNVLFHEPGGDAVDLSLVQGSISTGAMFYATTAMSPKGTQLIDVIFYTQGTPGVLPVGQWSITMDADTGAPVVDGYVQDDLSSWAVGVEWDASVLSETSTVGIPSVADNCIAINAQPDHVASADAPWYDMYYDVYNVPPGFAETQNQLRAYSPRGPRIDGVQKPDIVAPDNPWVASEHAPDDMYTTPYGSYRVFGGTSGASPHVTGVAALLAQAGIRGSAARDAIRAGADHDSTTGAVPNKDYGYGRLNAAAALGVTTTGGRPTVTLTATNPTPEVGAKVDLVPVAMTSDGDSAGLEAKWDDGYDGTWDTDYAAVDKRTVTSDTAGKAPYKVRVRDAGGRIAEAVVWVDFGGSMGAGGGDVKNAPKASSGCGCEVAGENAGALSAIPLMLGAVVLARRQRRRRGHAFARSKQVS